MPETQINDVVTYERLDDIVVIVTDNPPVNVLSAAVRQGLARALRKAEAEGARGAVLLCAGRGFFAGSDIGEFEAGIAEPSLPDLVDLIVRLPLPVVAAIHGQALGGGFEIALACRSRVLSDTARLALPEVKLGLLPGCGGTERLTRLAGPAVALDVVVSGRDIRSAEALELKIADRVVADDQLRHAAIAEAKRLASGTSSLPKPDLTVESPEAPDRAIFERARTENQKRFRGQDAPAAIVDLVEASATQSLDAAMALGRSLFARLEQGRQSKALRHLFVAERAVRKVPNLDPDAKPMPIHAVGIVGAGTMGGGIAMCFASAGIPVTLLDTERSRLERGLAVIAANYRRSVDRGRISAAEMERNLSQISSTTDYKDLGHADLIIEAVFEDMHVKKQVFEMLDRVAKPEAILASNTSFLDIDMIAAATTRAGSVVGLHFFSPANVMQLLEVVRATKTSDAVIATAMALARRIGKTAVCVGLCHGFVGNRMLEKRQDAAMALLGEGVMPWEIDAALVNFGMPMGPFAMHDLAGLDLGWTPETSASQNIVELLCEAGRFGQKNGRGFYDYDDKNRPSRSPFVEEIVKRLAKTSRARGTLTEDEILARCLDPMIAEGKKILEEGIAARSGDIDVIWVKGYGWPAWRGGPMYWSDHR